MVAHRWYKALLRRRRRESDFAAEVRAHIALEADRFRSEGLSDAEAEAAARRAFGNVAAAEERFYETRRWHWWEAARKDLQYAVRALARNPTFTISAILTLALGIGANTAIFSVVDAALLRPLPYPDADRIVLVYGRTSDGQIRQNSLAPATFLDYRRGSRELGHLAAFREWAFNVA